LIRTDDLTQHRLTPWQGPRAGVSRATAGGNRGPSRDAPAPQPTDLLVHAHHAALLSAHTPRAIRDALIGVERTDFEHRYAEEMAQAAQTLDLTGVLEVIDTFRKIAEITQRQGGEAHRVMLERAAQLQHGEQVPTVSSHVHKAETAPGFAVGCPLDTPASPTSKLCADAPTSVRRFG